MVPSFLNAGFNFDNFSIVVSLLTDSSKSKFLSSEIGIGTICSLKTPSLKAFDAFF